MEEMRNLEYKEHLKDSRETLKLDYYYSEELFCIKENSIARGNDFKIKRQGGRREVRKR